MPSALPTSAVALPLRDIHLPPAVSWWPPAPGWWLLTLVLLATLGSLFYCWRRRRQRCYQRLLLRQLAELEQHYRLQADPQPLLQGLSRLLRQAAQLHYPASNPAGLVGDAWLKFLDQTFAGEDFSRGPGQVLALGPYLRQNPQIDAPALLTLSRRWLRRLPPAPAVAGGGK